MRLRAVRAELLRGAARVAGAASDGGGRVEQPVLASEPHQLCAEAAVGENKWTALDCAEKRARRSMGSLKGQLLRSVTKGSGGGGVDRAQLAVEGSRRKLRTDATDNRAE